ncbi:uncharacterized protein CLUP02_17515 [Colletotrichum lupini]|uniref:Uncharacterized protein n=1 Tax=Colletotrichum lupini TaxID=145971 RepID=A0A9Q8SEZ7_9PEZI|nr:uncharacterized protein CLUP02_17515 [Colletotrichum lupini]UQC76005.1 hypothetical protein CLUP02_17515 [Colletotrichum lupini]
MPVRPRSAALLRKSQLTTETSTKTPAPSHPVVNAGHHSGTLCPQPGLTRKSLFRNITVSVSPLRHPTVPFVGSFLDTVRSQLIRIDHALVNVEHTISGPRVEVKSKWEPIPPRFAAGPNVWSLSTAADASAFYPRAIDHHSALAGDHAFVFVTISTLESIILSDCSNEFVPSFIPSLTSSSTSKGFRLNSPLQFSESKPAESQTGRCQNKLSSSLHNYHAHAISDFSENHSVSWHHFHNTKRLIFFIRMTANIVARRPIGVLLVNSTLDQKWPWTLGPNSSTFVGITAAQTTSVISVLNPYFGDNPYDASIKDANPTATTYIVSCQTNSTNYQCRADPSALMTLVGGPSTMELHIDHTASGVSIEYIGTVSGDGLDYQQIVTKSGNTAMMANMRLSPLTATSLYVPLTVTAGLEKLQQAQTGATATATATATASSSGSAQSGSGSAASATSAQASSTSTPNAAAPRVARDGLLAGAIAAVFEDVVSVEASSIGYIMGTATGGLANNFAAFVDA